MFWSTRITLLVAFAFVLTACETEEVKVPPPPPPVKVMKLSVNDVPVYSEWVGQTRGSVNTEIRARVQGFLDRISYKEGNFVRKGQVMYQINPLEYESYVNSALGLQAEAHANLARATQDVVRYKPLVEQNAISREEYETSVQLEKAARAALRAADAGVQKARLDLSYCPVIPPLSGLAGKTEKHIANRVGRGESTLLTTISVIDPIRVRFSLSERELLKYRRRNPGRVKREIELSLVLADGSTHKYPGRLVLADNRVDPETGTLLLEAEFPNPDKLLQPGQFARIRAATQVSKNTVVIPQRAVTELQGQARVMVLGDDASVTFRSIELGARVGSAYIVKSGIEAGETIVIEGLQRLRDGVIVNPSMAVVNIDSLVNRN